MNNAKITRIERVDGSMLSFHLALPKGADTEDFSEVIGDVLNCITDEDGTGLVNSFATETDLKVGDEITPDGEIIECQTAEGVIEETKTPERDGPSLEDIFMEEQGPRK